MARRSAMYADPDTRHRTYRRAADSGSLRPHLSTPSNFSRLSLSGFAQDSGREARVFASDGQPHHRGLAGAVDGHSQVRVRCGGDGPGESTQRSTCKAGGRGCALWPRLNRVGMRSGSRRVSRFGGFQAHVLSHRGEKKGAPDDRSGPSRGGRRSRRPAPRSPPWTRGTWPSGVGETASGPAG